MTMNTETTNGKTMAAAPEGVSLAPRGKLTAILSEAGDLLVERTATLNMVAIAALAGEHAILLGPPGEAKSLLARTVASAIDGATYFEWLMTKFTTPEEVFGPFSIAGLKQDRFQRVTLGKMPEAHVVFLDEIFKSNSAILNSLLSLVNERVFHDGTGPRQCPLVTCVAASNELPEGAELAALWDRFLVRCYVRPVAGEDAFVNVITSARDVGVTSTKLTIAEWAQARAEVDAMLFPQDVAHQLYQLRAKLAQEGIEVSTRRWKKCANLMRAAAWLDGSTEVSEEHCDVLSNALWNTPDQEAKVRAFTQNFASAELAGAQKVHDSIVELLAKLPADTDPSFEARVLPAAREVKKAIEKVHAFGDKAKGINTRAKIVALETTLKDRAKALVAAAQKAMGV